MDNGLKFIGKRVCFIGAHPDDIELGAGGLIAQISSHSEVHCITLSRNQKNPALANLLKEHNKSMTILGVRNSRIMLGDFETRRFPQARQEILEYLIEFNKVNRPDIVFTHTHSDIHQDHLTVSQEVTRAFRGTTVLGFDVIRSSHGFFPTLLIEVSEEDVRTKIKALAAYKTYKDKYYFAPELTRGILIRHGAMAERQFAEGFDIIRMIGSFGK